MKNDTNFILKVLASLSQIITNEVFENPLQFYIPKWKKKLLKFFFSQQRKRVAI